MISLIIPIKQGDKVEFDLSIIPSDWETIIIDNRMTRAEALNEGAKRAKKDFLWFVHADSRLDTRHINAVIKGIKHHPNKILYFGLCFYDGGWKMRINEIGAWLRCLIWKNPFGDQAYCMSWNLYKDVGGFRDNIDVGEDHLFILQAKHKNYKLQKLFPPIHTSAIKYMQHGWAKTVSNYQKIWRKQHKNFKNQQF